MNIRIGRTSTHLTRRQLAWLIMLCALISVVGWWLIMASFALN